MKEKYIIYGLIDPTTKELRYIGKSTSGIKRPNSTITRVIKGTECRPGKSTLKVNWIKKLLKLGLRPEIEILEVHTKAEDLPEAEIFWIAYYKFIGCRLTNMTKGGEGLFGLKRTEAQIEFLRGINFGNRNSLGKKKNLTNTQRQDMAVHAATFLNTPEIKAKALKARQEFKNRKPLSEETKAKISLKNKDRGGMPGAGRPKCSESLITDKYEQLFAYQAEAARWYKISPGCVRKMIKGLRPNEFMLRKVM